MDQYIGLDVAKKRTHIAVMTVAGAILRSKPGRNTPMDFAAFFDDLPSGRRVAVLEACRDGAMVQDLVERYVERLTLWPPAEGPRHCQRPHQERPTGCDDLGAPVTGRSDPARAPAPAGRAGSQQLLRQYTFFVAARTRLKQRIHCLIDRQGWEVRRQALTCRTLFGRVGLAWLRAVELPGRQRQLLEAMLQGLAHLDQQVRQHHRWIVQLATEDPAVGLLRSLPGIGPIWAPVIAVEIDGVARFPSRRQLASYAGLVPSTYASGPVMRHGPITKQGNRWLRTALVEAAWIAIRHDPWLKAHYRQLAARKGAKPAIVAVARKLADLCWVVLTEQRPYQRRPLRGVRALPESVVLVAAPAA